jgi:type VI secretion system protein ImpL
MLKLEGDHWTPNELAPQALRFDPKFLAGLRQLTTVGAQLYLRGDANERFEMMALPTPTVTRSELSVDGKQIDYFNQQESWTPLAWPGDGLNGHVRLTWQTLTAGLTQAFDSTGDWAFLRLLAQADAKPLDSARYKLTWNTDNGAPLTYVLRTEAGAGPLELLKLRGFRMPERIFAVGNAGAPAALPPLPPELQP